MNICLVGYGSIARMHAEALREEAGVTLHTVVGRVAESAAEFGREFGFQRHGTDVDAALDAPDTDVVVIASPSDLHAAQTERALRAGKHVLCEIPLATSLGEADRLIALAREKDRRLMVCHTQRYAPGLRRAREIIAAGDLHVHHIIYRYGFLRRENVNWKGRRRSWTDNLLWHHAGHTVDAALWLLGAREAEVAGHMALPGQALGIPMDLSISLRTPQDQLVTVAMSYNTHFPLDDCLIVGEETSLLYTGNKLMSKDATLYEPPPGVEPLALALKAQDHDFVVAVREGREPPISGEAVRPALVVLQTIQERWEARRNGAMHPSG